jgi:site-specific recombinase xerD
MERRKDDKGRVLKEGESQRKDGRYQYRYLDKYGKRHYIYSDNLKNLREQEVELQKSIDSGIDISKGKIKVYQLARKYTELHSAALKSGSYNTQKYYLNLIKNHPIGNKEISSIKVLDAKQYVKDISALGYCYGTINNTLSILRPAFQDAYDEDIIPKNPFIFKLSSVITNDAEEKQPITNEQYISLIGFMSKSNIYKKHLDEVVILYETGIRASELCGITVNDVDLNNKTLTISHQLLWDVTKKYHIQSPKSKSGNRTIPLTQGAYDAFKRLLSNKTIRQNATEIDGYSGFLFYSNRGRPFCGKDLTQLFTRIINAYNLRHDEKLPHITPHTLRHTFCTRMINSGLNPKSVQYLMGHSTIDMTLSVYAHASKETALEDFRKTIA